MTLTPKGESVLRREVMVTHDRLDRSPSWLDEVAQCVEPAGYVLTETRPGLDAVRRVEAGGVAAAILIDDSREVEALSLLRIIRSIDLQLPCWLIAWDTSRRLLEVAWSLNVTCVIGQPVVVETLRNSLRRVLTNEQNSE